VTLGPVRVMGAGVVVMMCVEEVNKHVLFHFVNHSSQFHVHNYLSYPMEGLYVDLLLVICHQHTIMKILAE